MVSSVPSSPFFLPLLPSQSAFLPTLFAAVPSPLPSTSLAFPRALYVEAARIRALDAELRRASLPRSPNGGGALAGRGAWAASPGPDPYDDDYGGGPGGGGGGGMDPDDDLDALINMENELREAAQAEDIDPDLLAEAEAHTAALVPAPDAGTPRALLRMRIRRRGSSWRFRCHATGAGPGPEAVLRRRLDFEDGPAGKRPLDAATAAAGRPGSTRRRLDADSGGVLARSSSSAFCGLMSRTCLRLSST